MTNRLASAPEESVKRGSSFVRIMNRVGSRPVQGSRYLRSIVSESSPEIESSRSTAIVLSARAPRRASEMTARGFPTSGCSPKFWVRLASVGAAVLCTPSSPVRTRAIVPLPGALRSDEQEHLLLRRVAGEDVAEPLGERGLRLLVVAPELVEEAQPACRRRRRGRTRTAGRAARRAPACAAGARGSRSRGCRSRAGRSRPR